MFPDRPKKEIPNTRLNQKTLDRFQTKTIGVEVSPELQGPDLKRNPEKKIKSKHQIWTKMQIRCPEKTQSVRANKN